jgi:hypothetical protein
MPSPNVNESLDQPAIKRLLAILGRMAELREGVSYGTGSAELEEFDRLTKAFAYGEPNPLFRELFALYVNVERQTELGVNPDEHFYTTGDIDELFRYFVFRFPADAKAGLFRHLDNPGLQALVIMGLNTLSQTPVWEDSGEKLAVARRLLPRLTGPAADYALQVASFVRRCPISEERSQLLRELKVIYQSVNPGLCETSFVDDIGKE